MMAPVTPGPEASPAPGAQGVVTLMAPAAQGASMLMTPGGQDATALMTPGALEATALTAPGVQGAAFERGSVETALAPVAGAPAALATPLPEPRTLPGAAAPGRPSLANSKASSRRKLAAASDVLSRYAARLAAPAPAVPAAPVPTDPPMAAPARPDAAQPGAAVTGPATGQWQASTGQWQQAQWGTAPQLPAGTVWPDAAASALATGSFPPPAFAEAGVLQSPAMPTPGTGTGTGPIPYPTAPATAATAPSPTPESSRAARAAAAIAFARGQIGKPCVWGAMGPGSYDCSSLTQAAWRSAGVTLPRAAHEQALAGAPVTLAGAEPGDLVLFFDDDRHVGLHVGGGMMVHAPGPGSTIREESIYGAGEAAIHRIVRPA
ncbi:C40 family peptidase [Streptomyces sp. tea 10]|nr:C40 family peptidase [Streptomyces sp. tea 10]